MHQIDTAAYDIRVEPTPSGAMFATVLDLPGCFAVAPDRAHLQTALAQAILLHLESNPDAPVRYRDPN